MPRYGGKTTVESCRSIDVLLWHRLVRYRSRSYGSKDWDDVERLIQINWSPCRFGGERPWLACSVVKSNGVFCGRRCSKLYGAGRLFACRHCYRLAYASQQYSGRHRHLLKAQRIRMRLGGTANLSHPFPDNPKGMHWRTCDRLRRAHDLAGSRASAGVMKFIERLSG
jgi:hypothetical protein